jgi:surface antigen
MPSLGERPRRESGSPRRLTMVIGGIVLLLLLAGIVSLLFSPLARNLHAGFASLQSSSDFHSFNAAGTDQTTATLATSTTSGSGTLNWPIGDCTYWANYRYHQLSGHWVSWIGNPDQWVVGARAAGWYVSTQPHIHSIIVLMPHVQLAGPYGSVGVVESIISNAVVHTSLMNWYNDGGGWDKLSFYDFNVGTGVYFIWHA